VKALSVRQPWAWAIIHAGKDIENRTWRTHYRGPLFIHASLARHSKTGMPRGIRSPREDALHFGAIIGLVELVDVVERSRSKWFAGPLGWVIANPYRLKHPMPCKGGLGLWNVPPAVARRIRAQLPVRFQKALDDSTN
jgi:hypothetical protein